MDTLKIYQHCLRLRQVCTSIRYILLVALIFFTTPAGANDTPQKWELVVIVSQDSSIDSLSRASLRAIFGMRKRIWQDGTAIKVFVLEDDNILHMEFSKKMLQTLPFNLRRIWERQVFSGTGQAPTTVASEEEMQQAIATTHNAIGYISRERLNDQVKMVTIQ